MEEQILKLMIPEFAHLNMVQASKTAEKITAMVMEFITWLDFGDHPFYLNAVKNETGYYKEGFRKIYTIDDLFQYWIENVKK
jgi:hypothetical protein